MTGLYLIVVVVTMAFIKPSAFFDMFVRYAIIVQVVVDPAATIMPFIETPAFFDVFVRYAIIMEEVIDSAAVITAFDAVMVTVLIIMSVVILDHLAMVVIVARVYAHATGAELDRWLRIGRRWSKCEGCCKGY